jgi:hypothetical protein
MGITIHYSGRAASHEAMSKAMNHAFVFGAQREWQCAIFEDPLGNYEDIDPENPGLVDEERKGPYAGVVVRPHPKCEPFSLPFSLSREFSGSTKTQYAPFEVHEELIQLLRELEPFLDYLSVVDEAGLWESDDRAAAQAEFKFLDRALDALADGLRDKGLEVEGPHASSSEDDFPAEPYG